MTFEYRTNGTCSRAIIFDLEDGCVHNVNFVGGCNGNLQAMGRLVEGKTAEEVISTLKGISCSGRPTSCGDQLARALTKAVERAKEKEAELKAEEAAKADAPASEEAKAEADDSAAEKEPAAE